MGDGHDPRDHSCRSAPAAIPPTLSTKPLNQTAAATHSSNREVLLQGHNRGSPPKKFCFCFSPCILKLYSLLIQALFEERGLMPTTLKVIYDAIRHANGGPLVINWTHVTTVSFCKTICCWASHSFLNYAFSEFRFPPRRSDWWAALAMSQSMTNAQISFLTMAPAAWRDDTGEYSRKNYINSPTF
jgi:ABC-type glycerol-3-phosphate transport system permease component